MSSNSLTLIPGYHQVDHFAEDNVYETNENGDIIEEVEYVTLDLGVVEPTLVPSTSSYRLIGLDTPSPYLQLSGTIFKGSHQELLGTELFFTDTKDDTDRSKKSLTHVANTERRIRFREVELKEKQTDAQSQANLSQYEHTSVNSKKRKPQTMEQLVGSEPTGESSFRGRGSRRGRGGRKSKGKERAADVPAEGVQMQEIHGEASRDVPEIALSALTPAEPMDTAEG